jgi:hypothetical protein
VFPSLQDRKDLQEVISIVLMVTISPLNPLVNEHFSAAFTVRAATSGSRHIFPRNFFTSLFSRTSFHIPQS